MVEQGWSVTVYCQRRLEAGLSADGSVVCDTWRGVRLVSIGVWGSGPLSTVLFDWNCIRHARGIDGVRLVLGYNTAIFFPVLVRQGQPVITNMDGIEWKRRKWPLPVKIWFYASERIACMLSTRLIADHPAIETHLAPHCKAGKIVTIPYGADRVEDAPAASVRDYGLESGRFVVSIARIEPENSILELVRAFSRRHRPYSMVCVGPFVPGANRYHRRVAEAASSQVSFLGGIYHKVVVAALRHHALAYLHGHTVGGTNPSLVEAMGAGSAIVAHRNRFNSWTAGPEQYYFSHEDECDEIFCRLADDPVGIARAQAAARARHGAIFTWESVLAAYQTLCSRYCTGAATSIVIALFAIVLCLQPSAGMAKYLLGPGDKLQVTISGSLMRPAGIDPDGDIQLPQVGNVNLGGLSLAAAAQRLNEIYRNNGILESPDVHLQIVEYRPFYIDGDVRKPGSYPYQPGMTVRDAMALAGGPEAVRFRSNESPFVKAVELHREYEILVVEQLRLKLRRMSVDAALNNRPEANFATVKDAIVAPAVLKELVDAEQQQFKQRLSNYRARLGSLQESLKAAQENQNSLNALLDLQKNSARQEEEQTRLTRANVARGASPQMRIAEVERHLESAQSRYVTTQAQIWGASGSVSDLQRQLADAEGSYRSELLREAEDTSVAIAKVASQIKAVTEELSVTAGQGSLLPASDATEVTIFRKENSAVQRRPATLDADIIGGDMIEIRLRTDSLIGVTECSTSIALTRLCPV